MIPAQLSITQYCIVCGEVSTPIVMEKMLAPVCQDLDCRRVAAKQESMPAFHFKCFLATQAKRIRAQRSAQKAARIAHEQEIAVRKKIKAETEAADEAVWWEKIQHHAAVQATPDIVKLIIPKGPTTVIAFSNERRKIHTEYLSKILQEADEATNSECDSDTKIQGDGDAFNSLAIGLCTACAGGCCTKGGDVAYLTADTMRRVRTSFPDLSSEDVLRSYLELLPSESMEGSCIYHTQRGCALPRDLRSDTCNQYACEALRALPKTMSDDAEQKPVLVFQRRQDKWRQLAVDLDNKIVAAFVLTKNENIYLN